jgi:phosphoglycolate phosphatase-like HAD superfamily hydrolase
MTAILALDFDGVICDSALETAHTALRVAHTLRPHEAPFDTIPDGYIERFLALRPAVESGFETPLVAFLALRRTSLEEVLHHTQRCFQRIQEELGVSRDDLIELHHSARLQWIESNVDEWLNLHRFYPGFPELLVEALKDRSIEPYIITTKGGEFALKLLAAHGIAWPQARIFGFGSGSKTDTLINLTRSIKGISRYSFVEDRLKTLRGIAKESQLDCVNLYLATWGYNTEADRAYVAQNSRYHALGLDEIDVLLRGK